MGKYLEIYGSEFQEQFEIADNQIKRATEEVARFRLFSLRMWWLLFLEIFLPRGYPNSVSSDYFEYQIWDTIQAFASSVTAALATEAVLRGAGIGNENASALAATITWLLKDGLGMISRILFTWLNSASLDANCKQWRLFADVLNDVAFSLDLIAPVFPNFFGIIVCISSVARSVVGVAGGATRTTITHHQAKFNNIADVAAKDGSQETLVNITALFCNMIILPLVSGKSLLVWLLYFLFTIVHLFANYRAVTALQFRTLNQRLLSLIARKFVESGEIYNICDANRLEPLLPFNRASRHYGCRISEVFASKQTIRFTQSSYLIAFDEHKDCGYLAVKTDFDRRLELEAAFQLEFISCIGKILPDEQIALLLRKLDEMGWQTSENRLNFDLWTYMEK